MNHPLKTFVAAALAVAVVGCASKPSVVERQAGPVPAGAFVQTWKADLDFNGQAVRSMVLSGGTLLTSSTGNVVVGLTPAGSVTARMTVAPMTDKSFDPIIIDEKIVVPTTDAVQVYDLKGRSVQTMDLDFPIRSNPGAWEKSIYTGADSATGGRLTRIALGEQYKFVTWSLLTGQITVAPVVHEGIIYVATDAGVVYAVTPDRSSFWAQTSGMPDGLFHAQGRITADLHVDDTGVYVASLDGRLYVLEPTTGRIKWRFTAGIPLDQKVAVSTDTAYLSVNGRGLHAFDLTPGVVDRKPRWINPDARMVLSDDKVNVYVLLADGRIAALDKKDGALKFASDRRDLKHFVTHLDPKDNTIFAATDTGHVIAITPVLKAGTEGVLVDSGTTNELLAAK